MEGEAAVLAAERRVADLVSSAHRLRTTLLEKKHSQFVARQRRQRAKRSSRPEPALPRRRKSALRK